MAYYPSQPQYPPSYPNQSYPPNAPSAPPAEQPLPNYGTQSPAYSQQHRDPMAYQDFRDEQPGEYPGVGLANVPDRNFNSGGRFVMKRETAIILAGVGVGLIVLAIILIIAV